MDVDLFLARIHVVIILALINAVKILVQTYAKTLHAPLLVKINVILFVALIASLLVNHHVLMNVENPVRVLVDHYVIALVEVLVIMNVISHAEMPAIQIV